MASDPVSLEEFLEEAEGAETDLDEVQEELEENSEDGSITLKSGNFEQLVVLMIQDLKYDMMNIKQYLALMGEEFDIEAEGEEE